MLTLSAGLVLAAHLLVIFSPQLPEGAVVYGVTNLVLPALATAVRARPVRKPFLALVIFSVAWVSATLQVGNALDDRLDADLDGETLLIEGVVASLPRAGEQSISFLLQDGRAQGDGLLTLPARIQVRWFRAGRRPAPGERWRLFLRLRAPAGTLNPGGFDQEAWFFRQRIGASASVVSDERNRRLGLTSSLPLLRLRANVSERIREALGDHPAQGLVSGLAVGLRNDISQAQWRTLADTGTGHLVAISGLHVGLVAGFVFALVRFSWGLAPALANRVAPLDVAWPPALLAAFTYALLAGFTLPTRRALLMLCLWFGARALRRPARPANVLGLALICSLTMDALSVLSPGFWMSFGAVAALFLAARLVARAGRLRLVPLQVLLFTGLAPLSFAAFGKLSLVAPLANLLMIPYFSILVIPLVLLYLAAAGLCETAAGHLLALSAWLIALVWPALDWLASAEGLQWHGAGRSNAVLMSLTLVALLSLAPSWPGKSALLGSLVLALLLASPRVVREGGLELTVLDVGHGLAVVLRTRAHALVYDTGPGGGGTGAPGKMILSALSHMGVSGPDAILLSHDDGRHVSGAGALSRRFVSSAILTGAPEAMSRRVAHYRLSPCQAGQSWQWDGVAFTILQPEREIVWEDDDSSCVLLVSVDGARVLITGDLTARGERRLLRRYPDLRSDVVIGLNHGSDTASSPGFVSAIGAGLAVFSAARVNPWGLPRREVLERWAEHGAITVDTGDSGAVTIRAGGAVRGWEVGRLRLDAPRLWRAAPLR